MDGRFRWAVKDMDWGFGLMTDQSNDTLSHAMNESSSSNMNSAQGFPNGSDFAGQPPSNDKRLAPSDFPNNAAMPQAPDSNTQPQMRPQNDASMGGGRGGKMGGGGNGFTSAESTLFFRKLLENEEFKAKFINRFCDVMNTNYDEDTVIAAINAMKDEIEPVISEQANRYPNSVSSVSSWETSINKMIQFAEERTGYMQSFLQSKFSLSGIVTVNLNADNSVGYIRINDTDIITDTKGVTAPSSWSGSYFAGTTQTFTAVPLEGRSFVKFAVTDLASGNVREYTGNSIEVTIGSSGTSVQAVFE